MTKPTEYTNPNYPNATYNEWELESMFDDYLDEVEGTVTLLGLEYGAAEAIKRVDPIAHRTAFFDWLDSEGFDEVADN